MAVELGKILSYVFFVSFSKSYLVNQKCKMNTCYATPNKKNKDKRKK